MYSRQCRALAASGLLLFVMTVKSTVLAGALPDKVDDVFASLNRSDAPGCAVSLVEDGRVVYERGYGMANLDYGIAISPQTVFYVASLSKQFTAAAVALLAEEERISLDDDIRKFVPELPAYEHPIRVRHLVHHTSGLPLYMDLWAKRHPWGKPERFWVSAIPEQEAIALLAGEKELEFVPGSRFRYSNSGYFLLSVIVKRASGRPLSQYADERIFRPLGMKNTHFHDDSSQIVRNRATAYLRKAPQEGGGFGAYHTSYDLVGDGGLFTTVGDLVLWDQNFYHNILGRRAQSLVQQLQSGEPLTDGTPNTYAFGLKPEDFEGRKAIGHGGWFIGFRSDYLRIPDKKMSAITLCNGEGNDPHELNRAALRAMLTP